MPYFFVTFRAGYALLLHALQSPVTLFLVTGMFPLRLLLSNWTSDIEIEMRAIRRFGAEDLP